MIAGGGVAGLEALLGLSVLAGDQVKLELLTPGDEFVYRPLLVAEPFGLVEKVTIDLGRVVADAGARHRRGALRAVDPSARTVVAEGGDELAYDFLLVALGARPAEAVPGALTFGVESERARFAELLEALGRRGTQRVTFVVPREVTWAIAAYELALLTAAEREARRLEGVDLMLLTHESDPLGLFGQPASQLVSSRLEQAGVELRTATEATRYDGRHLLTEGGDEIAVDAVVALPGLQVPAIEGLPQRANGFVDTDVQMHVAGLESVWAAGDITSFPIKQGGLAAQQADVAVRSIAARAGASVVSHPFQPVLRAAMLSGDTTDYLRSSVGATDDSAAATGRWLWWPSGKLAVNYLGSYLAGEPRDQGLVDLENSPDSGTSETKGDLALELVLSAADVEAAEGEYEDALAWIALAEQLNLVVPTRYVALRDEWRRQVDPDLESTRAAKRLGGRFDTAAAAISDLERRVGWLRQIESRTEHEMREHLEHLDEGLAELKSLSRRTGVLPRHRRGIGEDE